MAKQTTTAKAAAFFIAAAFALAAAAQEPGALGDVTEEWCFDAKADEIYAILPDGASKTLVVTEPVVMGENVIDSAATEQIFNEGLVEAVDGADALSTSFVADAWETVIETFYGHDAFGQRVEVVRETTNEAGDRCKVLKAPGFTTMYRAFADS